MQYSYGISITELHRNVSDYVEKNKIKHSFNKEKKQAGREFVAGFLKRQKIISSRKPEGVYTCVGVILCR